MHVYNLYRFSYKIKSFRCEVVRIVLRTTDSPLIKKLQATGELSQIIEIKIGQL